MQANGAVGDGKSETGTTGGAIARIADTIEGQEDVAERIFRHALTVIAHTNDGEARVVASAIFDRDVHGCVFWSVTDGVANNVFDGAREQLAVPGSAAGVHAEQANVALQALGFKFGVGNDVADQGSQIERFVADVFAATFEAREAEQASNEAVQAASFEFDAVEATDGFGIGAEAGEAKRDGQAGERRAQFVGDVCDEPALGGDERFDLLGHVIEFPAKVGELVATIGSAAADASAQMPCGEAMSGRSNMTNGGGDVAGEPEANESCDEKDHRGADELSFQWSAESVGGGLDGGSHDQNVAAAGGADGSSGYEFFAMGDEDLGVVGLQGGLGESFGFGRRGLREDFLAFVIEEVGLGVQGGIEGGEKIREGAHAVIVQDVSGACGDQRSDGAVGLRGAASGELRLGGDDGQNEGAADKHHREPKPEKNLQEQSAQMRFTR